MQVSIDVLGSGTEGDPYRLPPLVDVSEIINRGEATWDVVLSASEARQAKSDAVKAANALNVASAWADVEAVFGEDPLVPAIKKWLAKGAGGEGPVKKAWSEFSDPVPQGFVVSHDDALWKATTATSVEPSTTSGDWTQIFSV